MADAVGIVITTFDGGEQFIKPTVGDAHEVGHQFVPGAGLCDQAGFDGAKGFDRGFESVDGLVDMAGLELMA